MPVLSVLNKPVALERDVVFSSLPDFRVYQQSIFALLSKMIDSKAIGSGIGTLCHGRKLPPLSALCVSIV